MPPSSAMPSAPMTGILRERAHALKGASANLGALHLRDMARTLELEAQSQLDKGYPNAALSTPRAGRSPHCSPSWKRPSARSLRPPRSCARPTRKRNPRTAPRPLPPNPNSTSPNWAPIIMIWSRPSSRPRPGASALPWAACW
ncbi:MAG: Hpt domain-containing protein [Bilophila wadsworthia]